MWTIRRIRLVRVGFADARFLDVTLDLTSPTTGASVDTILWLRNGGGKTTIMALIGALLRPDRDEFLSSTDGARDGGRHIEDYILGPDTAHVAVEWGDREGRRLVTGAVYEWADRQPPADPTKDHDRLNVGWYAFEPLPARLEMDNVPYAIGAQRTTLEAFLSHLRQFSASTDVVVTRRKLDWTKALDARGIDSDLWRTILTMNRTEGGISKQFLFSSPDDFVRMLLKLITDPDESVGVADLLGKVAARLVRRPDLIEELRFAHEAVERLTELDLAWRDSQDAHALLAIAEVQARGLRAALRAGELVARATAATAEVERDGAALRRRDHDREAEVARHWQAEYRRLAAIHRRDAATDEVTAVAERLTAARSLVEAWTVAPSVAAHDAAAERERTLAATFAAATAEALPERTAYLAEAGHLDLTLTTLVAAAEAQGGAADTGRAAARREMAQAGDEIDAATGRRSTIAARVDELARLHRTLDDDLGRARAAGLLEGVETAAGASVRLRAADEEAIRAEVAATEDLARLETEIATVSETRSLDRADFAEARTALDTATTTRTDLARVIDSLAAEGRLSELLGAAEVEPLAMAPNLLAALGEAVARSSRELIDLGVAGAEDERALAALDSDEALLPPALDLTRVLAALADAKIPAVAGWSYLARMPAESRLATFLAVPTLTGGALVQDASDLPRARQILADADFAPTTIIGVGSTADLDAATESAAGGPFVIPANRALYDRDRARVERVERDNARHERSTQRASLETRQDSDRSLAARIDHLVATCPPELPAILDNQIARLSERQTELTAALERATETIASKTAERTAAGVRRSAAATRRLTLSRIIARVDDLALRETQAADTRLEASGLADRIEAERVLEATARSRRDDAQRRADDGLRRSLEMAETARVYRSQIAGLPVDRVQPAKPDGRSLDVLVAALGAAQERYEAQTTGSPLARQVAAARDERARLERELEGKPTAVLTHARTLIGTASGSDHAARDRALRAASAEAEQVAREDGLAQAEAKEAAAEVERYTRDDRDRHRVLDREPDSRAEALALAEEQRVIGERLNRLVGEDEAAVETAKQRLVEAERRAERLSDIADSIRLPEDEVPVVAPAWDAPVEEAIERVDALLRDISDADLEATRTKVALENLRARILTWSGDFPRVPAEVTSRFRSAGVIDELGPEAGAWAARLALRADELEADLAGIAGHRTNVVTRAIGMVNEALADLERFSRLSEMPPELGEAWGGRRFVDVHVRPTVDRSEPVMRDRIGREVDRLVAARAEPKGPDFLWRCVSAVAGDKGFSARVLKPSPAYSVERVAIEAMNKWSGGEKVTAALLIYVAVARLRARNRGRQSAGAGTLMLDNPLGTANYVPFLALQRAVARAAGVQLVFLTGVGDMKAVGLFPRIARLRNTPNRGRDYVSVEGYDNGPDEPAGLIEVTHGARTSDPLSLGLS